jgi:hypothetical protein
MSWLKTAGRLVRLACVLVPAMIAAPGVLVPPSSAEGAYLSEFTGNTQPGHVSPPNQLNGVTGTVSFAVFDRTGGTAGDTFGTGLADFDSRFTGGVGSSDSLDTSAKYLYLFQTTNNGPNADAFPVSTNSVAWLPGRATSWGSFAGTVFTSPVLGNPAGFYMESPPSTTGVVGAVVATGTGKAPYLNPGSTSLRAFYAAPGPGELTTGQNSILWGYTSNSAPVFGSTSLQDGGTSADGIAPTTSTAIVPEPPAALALALGLPLAGLLFRRRSARS